LITVLNIALFQGRCLGVTVRSPILCDPYSNIQSEVRKCQSFSHFRTKWSRNGQTSAHFVNFRTVYKISGISGKCSLLRPEVSTLAELNVHTGKPLD